MTGTRSGCRSAGSGVERYHGLDVGRLGKEIEAPHPLHRVSIPETLHVPGQRGWIAADVEEPGHGPGNI